VNFLIDAQLPPGFVRWLTNQGHTAEHVNYLSLTDSEDITIWNYALSNGSIIITKDEDFAERASRTAAGPVIVWLRIGNSTNRALAQWLEPRWAAIARLLNDGNRLIEVR